MRFFPFALLFSLIPPLIARSFRPERKKCNLARAKKELALLPSVAISVKDGRDHAKISLRDKHVEIIRGVVIVCATG